MPVGDTVVAAAGAVRVSVLGPLEVSVDGRPVKVGGYRVRALLVLLALDAGRAVPAHVLIEKLWRDERPADAANALQSLVSRLRRAGLPDGVLESSPAGYRLNVRPEAVDAFAFEDQVEQSRQALARGDAQEAAQTLRGALAAWRGGALADVADEEFAFAPTARLAELHASATLDRIEAELALGETSAATIGELKEITATNPLAERPVALLMRALAAVGRQSEALGAYQEIKDRLADDLGVDPSPQLRQAHLAVLRQEVFARPASTRPASTRPASTRAASTQPANPWGVAPGDADSEAASPGADSSGAAALRAADRQRRSRRPLTSFVGRDDDLTAVLKRLMTESIVTLAGPGGVGKTRLATETAARLATPVWLAELAPVTDPAEVPFTVLDAVGLAERSIAPHGGDRSGDPLDQLCAALADRDAVLILDNCEHVIDAAAALAARLVADCPGVKILATSREPLQISGETLHVVAPLTMPEAIRLFSDRAAAVVPGFEAIVGGVAGVTGVAGAAGSARATGMTSSTAAVGAADVEVITRICRTLDGMPLAIELAVPWLRTLSPDQLATRLDDRFALLTGGSRTALPRHQTLRAVVEWSWDLLTERQRALSRWLAVFPGGVTLTAAERACAGEPGAGGPGAGKSCGPLPASEVLPTLAELVAKSILTRADTRDDDEPRYRMLETVRAYALERLAESGEGLRAREAMGRYFEEFVEEADPLLRTKAQVRWFRALATEQDNINAALRWTIAQGDATTALRFIRSLGYFWVQRGRGDADVLSREVLAMTPPEPQTLHLVEGRVICALLAAGWDWDIDSVREPLLAAFADLDRLAADREAVHPLVLMSEPVIITYDSGAEQGQQYFERYVTARDPWLRAVGKIYVASYRASAGKVDGAEDICRDGLASLRDLGDQWGVATGLTQLAEFTEYRADHAASIAAITEAVAIGKELSVWGDLTYVRSRLAILYARAGDFGRTDAEISEISRAVEEQGGQVHTDRWLQFMYAELAALRGDYATAARCCEAVLAVISGHQARWWQSLRAIVTARLATAVLRLGDRARCASLLIEALEAAASWWEHPTLAVVLDACAAYASHSAELELSARLLGAAATIRGVFDESSLDAVAARSSAREALGQEAFAAAYASGEAATYDSALTMARDFLMVAAAGR